MIRGGRRAWWALVAACAGFALGVASQWQLASADDSAAATNDDVQDLVLLAPNGPVHIRLHLRVDGKSFHELQSTVARQLFDALDADGNGILEGKELDGIPTPELLAAVAKLTGPMKPTPKGHVTPEDLAAYLLPYSFGGFALAVESAQKPAGDYRARAFPDGMQRANTVDMASFLAVLDLDGDGRVTVAECARADELFHRLDLNDDETISRAEIAEVAAGKKNSAAKGPANPLSDVATLLKPMERVGTQLELARSLSDRYRRMSRAEAVMWLNDSPPRFELEVTLPKKTLQSPAVTVRSGSAAVDGDGIGVRTGSASEVVLQLGPLPIELHANEPPPRPVNRMAPFKAVFKRADRDSNDYLDANEFATTNIGLEPEDFKAIDADHNGMIFENEWLAFMTVYQIVTDNRVTLTVGVKAADPFAQFDANGDGRLTHGEWNRAMAAVRAWDTNHDGEISLDELPRHFIGTFHLGNLSPAPAATMMNDMYQTTAPAAPASSAPSWFQKMDRNRDGEVSLREFLGPLSVFRRLDTNHDGYLDANEARGAGGETGRLEK